MCKNAGIDIKPIETKDVKFGSDSFIEVAHRTAKTAEDETELISVSKGYYLPNGSKKFEKSISLPNEPEVLEEIAEILFFFACR
jgi:hypothetical protein